MKIFRNLILIILCFTLSLSTSGESVREALGDNNYLLAVNTSKGDAYANGYQRTYNPSIERWGTKTGVMPNGDAIIQLDSWTIADILGENYHVLAFTPERGNCYVNANNETYTPGSNQYGRVTGRTPDGLPIISVIGTIYPQTYTTITRTTTYGNGAPGQPATATPTPTPKPAGNKVVVYSDRDVYHKYAHNGDNYYYMTEEEAIADGRRRCKVCW